MIEQKNTQGNKFTLGQFFTPSSLVDTLVDAIKDVSMNTLIVEPSCGEGAFTRSLSKQFKNNQILSLEIDQTLEQPLLPNVIHKYGNFYDWMPTEIPARIKFVGNPPYRTPAYSLSTHKTHVTQLMRKYGFGGVKEEAMFFIFHCVDVCRQLNITGSIDFIIPKIILTSDTKYTQSFRNAIVEHTIIKQITSIDGTLFDGVSQDLVFFQADIPLQKNAAPYTFSFDGVQTSTDDFLLASSKEAIPFQQIFMRTYLGSVPCESIFVSVSGEPLEHFSSRINKLMSSKLSNKDLYVGLTYDDTAFLKVLSSNITSGGFSINASEKLNQIRRYCKEIQQTTDLSIFKDQDNYKPIVVRNDVRYYFRHPSLKRLSFVYEINPNPGPSFFFTGNPSHTSTDYFGFCDYDVLRNSSPGACRTVPVQGLDLNLTDEFKAYWNHHTNNANYLWVFDYLIHVSQSQWYKNMKRTHKRFYFSIPKTFDSTWKPGVMKN